MSTQLQYLVDRVENISAELMSFKKGSAGVRGGSSFFIASDRKFRVPDGLDMLLITATGGGGSGGASAVINGAFCGGGGGGAGEHVLKRGVRGRACVHSVHVSIGMGGQGAGVAGRDTIITVEFADGSKEVVVARGGRGGGNGVNNTGGQGGQSPLNQIFNGGDGKNGETKLASQGIACAGMGGNSANAFGGRGGNSYLAPDHHGNLVPCPQGENGQFGSGGGGAAPGAVASASGMGGDGYCILEW